MRRVKSAAFAGLLALGLVTPAVWAQQRPDPEKVFAKLDANGDGKLSLEEYIAPAKTEEIKQKRTENFKRLDKDGDGFLTLEEFKAGLGRRRS